MKFAGNIIVYEGGHDSSKQLAAVREAIEDKPKLIFSNQRLYKTGRYRRLDLLKLLDSPQKLAGSIILANEGYIVFNYRKHQTKVNKLWSYFLVQSRRLDVKVLITCHTLDYLDKRIRMMTTDRVLSRTIPSTKKLELIHLTLQPERLWIKTYRDKDTSKLVKGHYEEFLTWQELEREVVLRSNRYKRFFSESEKLDRSLTEKDCIKKNLIELGAQLGNFEKWTLTKD